MTLEINLLNQTKTPHSILSYAHDANAHSFGMEAVEKLGLDSDQVFKTLLAQTEKNELLVAVVPVSGTLD